MAVQAERLLTDRKISLQLPVSFRSGSAMPLVGLDIDDGERGGIDDRLEAPAILVRHVGLVATVVDLDAEQPPAALLLRPIRNHFNDPL